MSRVDCTTQGVLRICVAWQRGEVKAYTRKPTCLYANLVKGIAMATGVVCTGVSQQPLPQRKRRHQGRYVQEQAQKTTPREVCART